MNAQAEIDVRITKMCCWGCARAVVVFFAVGLAACAPLTQYRTDYAECVSPAYPPSAACEQHAVQRLPSGAGANYLLGFIEFDDQGQLWDRQQMSTVVDKLTTEAADKDLLMVVFVHGWKHSAAPNDENITTFRSVLAQLSEAEKAYSAKTGSAPRQVAGVYLGWRGGSFTLPLAENLSFWERKNTAQKVGHVGVAEVLSRLDAVKRDKDRMEAGGSQTRLVVVGHSFGGAVVNAALAQLLARGFVQTTGEAGERREVAGFGNLVVLINPAFEALLFAPLSDMSTEQPSYFRSQLPVLAVLTSEADYATRYAFPAGRWFATFFEDEREMTRWNGTAKKLEVLSERGANLAAVGHYEPYRTHRLLPVDERTREQVAPTSAADSVDVLLRTASAWAEDTPGSKIAFDGLMLERTPRSAGRNPYLIIHVDRRLIHDHNDIDDPRIVGFIKQLILLSSQSQSPTKAGSAPASPAP